MREFVVALGQTERNELRRLVHEIGSQFGRIPKNHITDTLLAGAEVCGLPLVSTYRAARWAKNWQRMTGAELLDFAAVLARHRMTPREAVKVFRENL